ncbi:MAG: aspartate carbamoyltransferase [Clostridioides sp.]|jgi:aspartate carbamoyltransferase catalytic subunit|nr:aspartate carbamoyltransferase [Clostridioides sp.]
MINIKSRDLIQPDDFSVEEINSVLELACDIIKEPKKYTHICDGYLLATLFFEPSTRTRLSFEAAMNRLGGRVIGFSDSNSSSTTKGESLEDTIKIISNYADIIAMRHFEEGSATRGALVSSVPVINAGDGKNQHPTQTLTDLLTIKSLKNTLENQVIGLCGDLKYGRTVHSLVKTLARYKNNKFIFISPEELKMPDYIKDELDPSTYMEVSDLESSIPKVDILYMTRIQQERFSDSSEYERLKDVYILNKEKLDNAKEDMLILHPLPRVNEISTDVDSDKRAVYFEQAKFGMYVRMALIIKLLKLNCENF